MEDFILIKDIYKLKYIDTYIDKHLGTCFFFYIVFSVKSSIYAIILHPLDDSLPIVFHIYLTFTIQNPPSMDQSAKICKSPMDLRARSGAGLPDGYLDFWSSVGDPTEHVKKRNGHWLCCGHLVFFFWGGGGGVIGKP